MASDTIRTIAAEVLAQADALLREKARIIVAIDGRCASGKTTLAQTLRAERGCEVVHMDSFFLRPEQRTQARLAEAGGNLDRERFLAEVLLPLSRGEPLAYRPYDCRSGELAAPVFLPTAPLTVIEGSYSCHPDLIGYYDLRVFLSTSPQEQLRRIAARDAELLTAFCNEWIPLEERYIATCKTDTSCQLRYDT